jgi:hypothetical protein
MASGADISNVKTCPRCDAVSPPTAFKCRSCGALLVAAPAAPTAPLAPVAAPPHTPAGAPAAAPVSAPTATAVDDRFFAPTTFTPTTFTTAPEEHNKRVPTVAIIVALALVVAGVLAFHVFTSSGSGADTAKTPVVLAPLADGDQSLPSLADAVRAQAEGARSRAFNDLNQVISASPNGRADANMLKQADGSIEFLDGSVASKNSKQASFAQSADTMVVAVSAASKDVCAFQRQVGSGDPEVVTMGNDSSCKADDAPTAGWIPLRDAGTSRGAVMPQN